MQFQQFALNNQQQELPQIQPAIIWVDVQSEENQGYQEQLMEHFKDQFQGIQDFQEAVQKIFEDKDFEFTIISNAFCAKQLVDIVQNKIIVFCGQKEKHMDFFSQNQQIIAIEDSNFNRVLQLTEQSIQQQNIINNLISLYNPHSLQAAEYQHSKQHGSIQFLVVMEELQKNIQIEEADINWEILQLLKKKHNEETCNKLFHKMVEGMKQKQKLNNLFDKLIYYYSRDEIYSELNKTMALSKFSIIKSIMVCLFQGFKNQNHKSQFLYRGISFGEENLFEIVKKDLQESLNNHSSLYWNTLTSTSESQEVAINFAYFNLYRILYVIIIDEEMPHPMFKLEEWHSEIPQESEVLLFPQFQFTVIQIDDDDPELLKVYIKQVKNNFSFALDPILRKIYWDSIINDVLRPKIKSILKFNRLRLDFIMDTQMVYNQAKLQIELRHYFAEIKNTMANIVSSDILEQINKLINLMMENFNIEKFAGETQQFYSEFPKFMKQVEKNLFHNLCEILIKGMINFDYCADYLKDMAKKFCLQVTDSQRQCFRKIDEFQANTRYENNFLKGLCNILTTGLNCWTIGIIFTSQTKLFVEFSDKNKSTYQDSCLIDPGIRPNIIWTDVDEKVNSLILLSQTPSKVLFCIPNIDKEKGGIFEDEDLGIMIGQYKYIGPSIEDESITFKLFGISETHVDEDKVLTQLSQNVLNVITTASEHIELQ